MTSRQIRPVSSTASRSCGFTLIEIAFVLIIVGIISNQILAPFGSQFEQRKRISTGKLIDSVINATLGYTMANQRLPCPASANTQGHQLEQCLGALSVGYVPAVSLGVQGTIDGQGRLLDAWGRPLIYAVSTSDHPSRGQQGQADFLTAGEMSNVGLSYLESNLIVCRDTITATCPRAKLRANQVPFIVLSLGANSSAQGQQSQNQNSNGVFVSQRMSKVPGAEFDDIVDWVSESRFIHSLVMAGTL